MLDEKLQTIPMASFEAQASRYARLIAHLAIGWGLSTVVLAACLIFAIAH